MTEVWMHKETGDLMIAYAVYVQAGEEQTELMMVRKIGIAMENEYVVNIIFPDSVREYFEVIGEL